MIFGEALFLLAAFPLLALMIWNPLPSRTLTTLRVILYTLIVLALADLSVRLPDRQGVVVVVADRSSSMTPAQLQEQADAVKLIERRQSGGNRLGVVAFANGNVVEKLPEAGVFEDFKSILDRDQTNLKAAVQSALALIPQDSSGRLLVLSDGNWTGADPSGLFALAAARNIPVDFRRQVRMQQGDLAILEVDAPGEVAVDEYFTVGLHLSAPQKMAVKYTLLRNEQVITSGELELEEGSSRFYFKDRIAGPQVARYRFEIDGGEVPDMRPENNQARFLVRAAGQRPLLLITDSEASGLAGVLRKSGLDVVVRRPQQLTFQVAELASYAGIIIENVMADAIGRSGLQNIAEMVRNGNCGLWMTGGQHSFALGGYFKSPLEEVLPVSMELRREHRKMSLAVAVALDRSGSMAASVGDGKTKMDLANLATVEVLDMLSPLDEIAVFAVDTEPHEVVPLLPVSVVGSLRQKILDIQSMGGGIFVYTGLLEAIKTVSGANSGTRHIILFADAADAEEPGNYQELLFQCTQAGMTVSVIGLGKDTDSDAAFLQDVAARGGGRCFFTDRADELPRLFALDTIVVARNTFVEEPTAVKLTGAIRTLRPAGFGESFSVDGYNLCYLRPGAQLGIVTEDSYQAPILAWWQVGLGRAAAFTGEVDGKYSASFVQWPAAGELLTSVADYIADYRSGGLPDNMLLTQRTEGGVQHIRLLLDPERHSDSFRKLPEVVVMRGDGERPVSSSRLTMQWLDPDTLAVDVPLSGRETTLATVLIENVPPQTLPPVILPYSPEYRPLDKADFKASLESLCRLTGGIERLDLDRIWDDLPSRGRVRSWRSWLLAAAILVLLLEVLERRLGVFGMLHHWWKRSKAAVTPKTPAPRRDPEQSGTEMSAMLKQAHRRHKILAKREAKVPPAKKTPASEPEARKTVPPAAGKENALLDAMKKVKKSGK
ncbi:VWA domain-containing protein [Victivallis sp. Marseille-Q1083]|uniref:VWA domain-containing protein n=1 Tax=Victivallis sp. Marseille-Q1083 TaxID=2717288 RepID=UPI00158F5BCC|nr:VWA domain-containing protein [Victivallis sp. Marseille-Q1083]